MGASATTLVVACQYLPSLHDDVPGTMVPGVDPSATVQILVSSADRASPGAVLPVTILAEWKGAAEGGGTIGCVAFTGAPGKVAFPLPSFCADGGAGGSPPASAEGGADGGQPASGEGGPPTIAQAESTTVTQCVAFNAKAPDGIPGGQAIASYTLAGTESAATLFAALYATADCTGPQIASNSAFEILGAPGLDAGVDATEADATEDGTAEDAEAPDSPAAEDALGGDDGGPGEDGDTGEAGEAASESGGPGEAGDAGGDS